MSNLIKEDDLDSFLDSYLKSLILPKIIGLSGPLGAGKTTIAKKIINSLDVMMLLLLQLLILSKIMKLAKLKYFM